MQDSFTTKHLTFSRLSLRAGRKTSEWSVWNHSYGERLGKIAWYGPWRQYCFFGGELVFSAGCLSDIAQMCNRLMEEHRSMLELDRSSSEARS